MIRSLLTMEASPAKSFKKFSEAREIAALPAGYGVRVAGAAGLMGSPFPVGQWPPYLAPLVRRLCLLRLACSANGLMLSHFPTRRVAVN